MAAIKAKRFQAPRHWDLARRLAHYSKPSASGCLLYTGTILWTGYGQIVMKGKKLLAHRAAWIAAKGQIPRGKCVCHTCDVRNCIRVSHLWLGTHADNNADMVAKGRGRWFRGEACVASKLTAQAVRAIRADPRVHRLIAADYNVSDANIDIIKSRKTWKHI